MSRFIRPVLEGGETSFSEICLQHENPNCYQYWGKEAARILSPWTHSQPMGDYLNCARQQRVLYLFHSQYQPSFLRLLIQLQFLDSSSPLFPTPWGVYPLSIVYVKKMIIIYRIWDQKFHLPFPCPLLCVYVSKLQMTQTFPQAIIRHKNVQQMLCVCLGRTQCLIIGNFCLIKIAKIIHIQYKYNPTLQ